MNQIVRDAPREPRTTPRIEGERAKRRRRDDLGPGRGRHLEVTGNKDANYEYRWVNDDPGRMHSLTVRDDWDPVKVGDLGETHDKDKNIGTIVERIVDKASGKRAVLLRKPKEFYSADKAKEQAAIDETESAIKRGAVEGAGAQDLNGRAYIPSGGIQMSSGGRTYTP
jgi:hypothetical protein